MDNFLNMFMLWGFSCLYMYVPRILIVDFFFSFIKCDYCPASAPTVSVVSKCPTTKAEWDQAASRKKCSHMSAKCGDKSPVYHCLLNQWGNETVEVCASTWYMSGNEVARSLMFMTCLSCSQSSSFESTTSL